MRRLQQITTRLQRIRTRLPVAEWSREWSGRLLESKWSQRLLGSDPARAKGRLALLALAVLLLGPGLIYVNRGGVEPASAMTPSADDAALYAMAEPEVAVWDIAEDPPAGFEPARSPTELASRTPTPAAEASPDAPTVDGYDCIIEPSEQVVVGTAETGVLAALLADRSHVVEAGQVVAELESGVEEAAVAMARARAQMDAGIQARKASFEQQGRRERRASNLFLGSVLSADAREQAETDTRIAALEVEEAVEEQRLARLSLSRAEGELARRQIRTPISGVVVERLKSRGEVVKEEGILRVAKIDPLWVEVVMPAGLFGSVKAGMRAEVAPEPPSEGSFVATVGVVDGVIDPASSTFGVRLELSNPDHRIPSGLHCQVRFLSSLE